MRGTVTLVALVLVGCTSPLTGSGDRSPTTAARSPSDPPIVSEPGRSGALVAVGDIACAPGAPTTRVECHHASTAALLDDPDILGGPDLLGVLLLGDTQYETGSAAEYRSFDESWGRVLERSGARILPVAGNHEYGGGTPPPAGCTLVAGDRNACGFFTYFSARTGVLADGDAQYAVVFGRSAPHPLSVIVVDVGRCDVTPQACGPDGPVVRFLRAALDDPIRNPPEACTIVAWHQARWSELGHGDLAVLDPAWRALFEVSGAQRPDLVLNGHDHVYERYPRLGVSGEPDPDGIVEIVSGAGGRSIGGLPFDVPAIGALAALDVSTFGVVELVWDGSRGGITSSFVTERADVRDRVHHPCRV